MTNYEHATDEQLRQAKRMARYDIDRYAKWQPDRAVRAQREFIRARDELKARLK